MIRLLMFRRAVRHLLAKDLRSGKITQDEYDRLTNSLTIRRTRELVAEAETGYGALPPTLQKIFDYVVQNWDSILKALILLISLVSEEE